jgi:16S rRNA (adenine1518-N6/adenine1519-N6)-dimethyltransferase
VVSAARGPRARGRGAAKRTSATGRQAKELGQNFLRDPNILGVIARESELSAGDVVLEVGGGEGVLSAYLAPRVEWVHVVELDERLRPALEGALEGFENATLWWGDALRVDLTAMFPAPTKMVANLPYGIAAGVLLRTIEELPGIQTWVVMVQREVGERLAASSGSAAYGVPSAIAQLACEVRVLRAIPRTVFRPSPNVDSVLVGLRRTAPAPSPGVRALVRAAFAHRRKTLAGSLELAGQAGQAGDVIANGVPRARAREALVQIGHPPDVRAERLSPADFQLLADRLGLA